MPGPTFADRLDSVLAIPVKKSGKARFHAVVDLFHSYFLEDPAAAERLRVESADPQHPIRRRLDAKFEAPSVARLINALGGTLRATATRQQGVTSLLDPASRGVPTPFGGIVNYDDRGSAHWALVSGKWVRRSGHEHPASRRILELTSTNPDNGKSYYTDADYQRAFVIQVPIEMANAKDVLDRLARERVKNGTFTPDDLSLEGDVRRTIRAREIAAAKRRGRGLSTVDLDKVTDGAIWSAAVFEQGNRFRSGRSDPLLVGDDGVEGYTRGLDVSPEFNRGRDPDWKRHDPDISAELVLPMTAPPDARGGSPPRAGVPADTKAPAKTPGSARPAARPDPAPAPIPTPPYVPGKVARGKPSKPSRRPPTVESMGPRGTGGGARGRNRSPALPRRGAPSAGGAGGAAEALELIVGTGLVTLKAWRASKQFERLKKQRLDEIVRLQLVGHFVRLSLVFDVPDRLRYSPDRLTSARVVGLLIEHAAPDRPTEWGGQSFRPGWWALGDAGSPASVDRVNGGRPEPQAPEHHWEFGPVETLGPLALPDPRSPTRPGVAGRYRLVLSGVARPLAGMPGLVDADAPLQLQRRWAASVPSEPGQEVGIRGLLDAGFLSHSWDLRPVLRGAEEGYQVWLRGPDDAVLTYYDAWSMRVLPPGQREDDDVVWTGSDPLEVLYSVTTAGHTSGRYAASLLEIELRKDGTVNLRERLKVSPPVKVSPLQWSGGSHGGPDSSFFLTHRKQ